MARYRDERAPNASRVRDRAAAQSRETRAESKLGHGHGSAAASTNANSAQRRTISGVQKPASPKAGTSANNSNPTANRKSQSHSQAQPRKNDTNQNYIRNFPSIMHLINEYPHIRQLLEETAADKDRPVEMFSTHFLSAMLVPEGESLQSSQYVVVNDPWRQEWERGVQVPVNMHNIPQAHVRNLPCGRHSFEPSGPLLPTTTSSPPRQSNTTATSRRVSQASTKPATTAKSSREPFRLPPKRYLTSADDGSGNSASSADTEARTTGEVAKAPAADKISVVYDADRLDVAWLSVFNESFARSGNSSASNNNASSSGATRLSTEVFERLIETFETAVNERLRAAITQQESFFRVQFDQSIVCDVCRSPNASDARNNAMVFCDACNVCVHQQCYGVQRLPAEAESWLCSPCSRSLVAPPCALCGFSGGALKPFANPVDGAGSSLGSGDSAARASPVKISQWAHISCALWLPEYSIADATKMEPVVSIGDSNASRNLKCAMCSQHTGVCVKCSNNECTESFHVTCAMAQGLQLRAVPHKERIQQLVFCRKHSKSSSPRKRSPNKSPTKRPLQSPTSSPRPQKNNANAKRPAALAAYVDAKRIILARTIRSRSLSSSSSAADASDGSKSGSEDESAPSTKKRGANSARKTGASSNRDVGSTESAKRRPERVIPQAAVAKCYRELEERVASIRARFERAARSVLDVRTLETYAKRFNIKLQTVRSTYTYWLLKRRANRGEPLIRYVTTSSSSALHVTTTLAPNSLSPRSPNTLLRPVGSATPSAKNFVVMNTQTNQSVDLNRLVANARSFIGLRRNLERLRNLCYLVIRRERLRRALVQAQAEIIDHQMNFIPKAPAALWQAADPPDASLNSSVSSFVAACALSPNSNSSAHHAAEASEVRRLLLNAHVGDSFYENADVLNALELVYEQLCAQQERESWRRTRTEPAVRSEQAAAAMLKRTNATAQSINANTSSGSVSNVNPVSASGSTAKPESRKRPKKQQVDEKQKRRKQELQTRDVKVKREPATEASASRKRKVSTPKLAVKPKRIRVKKENGFDSEPADSSSESAASDSEYETANEMDPLPEKSSAQSSSSEDDSQSESDDNENENGSDDEGESDSDGDGDSSEEQSDSADESGNESESASKEGDKENLKVERKPAPNRPRKQPVLGERRSPGGPASKASNTNATANSRRRAGLLRGKNGLLLKSSTARPVNTISTTSNRKRDVAQASNTARKAALKKLKVSLKVNMRNMKLRPRNGLALRVRSPAKAHN